LTITPGLDLTVSQNIIWLHRDVLKYENANSGGVIINVMFNGNKFL